MGLKKSLKDAFNQITLENQVSAFMRELPEMLKEHEDDWVLFGKEGRLGYYQSEMDCVNAGYKKLGEEQFLVRQVSKEYIEYGRHGKPIQLPPSLFPYLKK